MFVVYKNKGFTLVELLVAVAILAVLAVALLPRLLPYSEQSRKAVLNKDIRNLSTVIEIWAAQNGDYPEPSLDLDNPNSIASVMQSKGFKWTEDENGVVDPWGNPYIYEIVAPE